MQLTFIGTGNCAGIPVYNCPCEVCSTSRTNPSKRRGSSCALLVSPQAQVVIDAGVPDLGERLAGKTIDLVLISHYHVDHVQGLFVMRWGKSAQPLPVYGPDYPEGCADLLRHPGIFDFSSTLQPLATVSFRDLLVTPLPLNHSKPSLGFALDCAGSRLAWLCDTSGLPAATSEFLQRWHPQVMVVDCTFPPLPTPHPNHNDIDMAIALHGEIAPEKTYLTHIGHELELWLATSTFPLPPGVHLAADGVQITL